MKAKTPEVNTSTCIFSADITPGMPSICRVTKGKVLFLFLGLVFNFNLFEFSAAILEKGLFDVAFNTSNDKPIFVESLHRAGSLPNSPLGCPPSRLERKLTMKAKELKDALQSCHTLKDESANMKKSLEELQTTLEEKEKSLRNAEYERDLLEKEKVLYDTQIKARLSSNSIYNI